MHHELSRVPENGFLHAFREVLTDVVLVLSDEELHGALWAKHGSTLPLALLHLAFLWPRLVAPDVWPCVEAGYADPGSPRAARLRIAPSFFF